MAETNTTSKKYFLDLGGLTTLWGKIKSTFADKASTEASLTNINTSINNINTTVSGLDADVTALETTVLSIAPKEADNYTKALAAAAGLSVGTIIDVKDSETITNEETGESITYGSGLYIVESTDPVVIKSLSTSSGSDAEEGIDGLNVRIESLEQNAVKSATIVNEAGAQLGSYTVTNNTLLVAHDDTFDIDSQSVKALTHRAIAAKFKGLESIITGIPKFKIAVVDELPTEGISTSTIYLVKNDATSENNLFTEYIYVEKTKDDESTTEINESTYVWEKLGEQSLDVSNYVNQTQLNEAISLALSKYMKSEDIQTYVSGELLNLKNSILSETDGKYASKTTVEELAADVEELTGKLDDYVTSEVAASTYLTKSDAASTYLSISDADSKGWLTETQIITSIQEGNIGAAIAITDEQIDDIVNPTA